MVRPLKFVAASARGRIVPTGSYERPERAERGVPRAVTRESKQASTPDEKRASRRRPVTREAMVQNLKPPMLPLARSRPHPRDHAALPDDGADLIGQHVPKKGIFHNMDSGSIRVPAAIGQWKRSDHDGWRSDPACAHLPHQFEPVHAFEPSFLLSEVSNAFQRNLTSRTPL
jgi:hypothetical protein